MSTRRSAVIHGPMAGETMRMNRNDAPQMAASASSRAASAARMERLLLGFGGGALLLQLDGLADLLLRALHGLLALLELPLLDHRAGGGGRGGFHPAAREGEAGGDDGDFHSFFPFSSCSRRFLRCSPQAYPPSPPSVRTARWQGTASATGFAPQALPTALTARGAPMARAISA